MTDTSATLGRLRVILRSHGGENLKSRPGYYSKLLCLVSVIRAAQESGTSPQMIFWNDGPVPGERLELMRTAGEVVQVDVGSNRGSYRAAVAAAARGDGAPDDLVWFAEDDYLYRPDSFRLLAAAWNHLTDADYLSMYGDLALDPAGSRAHPRALPAPGAAQAPGSVTIEGVRWFRGLSTTSTFGVRLGVLRADRRLLRAVPFSGGAWDHTTCLTVQGLRPFSWPEVAAELLPFSSLPPGNWPASIARGVLRAGVNLRAMRAPARRRRLYLSDPVLAAHLEVPLSGGEGRWKAVAAGTVDWARRHGVPLDRPAEGGTGVASRSVSGGPTRMT